MHARPTRWCRSSSIKWIIDLIHIHKLCYLSSYIFSHFVYGNLKCEEIVYWPIKNFASDIYIFDGSRMMHLKSLSSHIFIDTTIS